MNDSENLSKLLGHLPPTVFREFMVSEFSLAMPELDKKQGKQEQRAVMEPVLSALDVSARRKIEELAERIVLLSDGAGQDVIEGISQDIVGDDAKAAWREVSLGAAHDGLRVVNAGLKPGERIIVNGLQRVRPGATVAPEPVPMAQKSELKKPATELAQR